MSENCQVCGQQIRDPKDVAEIKRLTAENERLRALITIIAERHSRVGDLEYDDVIGAAVSGCQQKED